MEGAEPSSACAFRPGELLVSELMIAPSGDATEWLELYNPGFESLSLAGVSLTIQGSGEERAAVLDPAWKIEEQDFFVVSADATIPDNATGGTLSFRLADHGAVVRLRCGDTVVDAVNYGSFDRELTVVPGVSLSRQTDTGTGAGSWCEGVSVYDASNRGTPGAVNPVCAGASLRSEDEGESEIPAPLPGEVVITEVLADPVGADDERDWVEVVNLTDHTIDLQSLTLINLATRERKWSLDGGAPVLLESGSLGLIGSDRHVDGRALTSAVADFSLYNQASTLELRSRDDVIDRVELLDPVEGYALKIVDSDAQQFCLAHSPIDTAEFGTPGEVNPPCEDSPQQPTRTRGEVVFSEVFANAEGSDDGREFVELFVVAEDPVDLQGLEITATNRAGSERRWLLTAEDRAIFSPGEYVVIGVEEDPVLNGGLTLNVLATGPSSLLYNDEQELYLVTPTGKVIDSASLPVPIEGVSFSAELSASSAGDEPTQRRWCAETRSELFSGIGSPGHSGVCQ